MRAVIASPPPPVAVHRGWDLFLETPVAMCFVDLGGHIIEANPALGRLLDYLPEELVGVHLAAVTHPDDLAASAALGEPRPQAQRMRKRYLARDGRVAWVELVSSVVRDERGRPLYKHNVVLDVTDARRAEEEREVAARESEAKSLFLATMSHELRTPLNSVLGFAQLLASSAGGVLDEKGRRYLANILSSGRHLQALVTDTLELSRIQSDQVELALRAVDLSRLLAKVSAQMLPAAVEKGVAVKVESGPDLVAWADEARLGRVLTTVIGNAIKFTPGGGWVRISARGTAAGVAITVADSGVGIAAGDRERIFEPFVQGDSGPSRSHDGAGLDLALVRAVMARMEGSIELDTEPAQGAAFTLTLPLPAAVPARRARPG